MLLPIVFLWCTLLPTAFSRFSNQLLGKSEGIADERGELIQLLRKYKNLINHFPEHKLRSVHDNVNEVHWRDELNRIRNYGSFKSEGEFEDEQKEQLVNAMNEKLRGVGAADMNKLSWNDKLATLAEHWSKKCNFAHGEIPFNADDIKFITVGQTLWAYEGDFDAQRIVNNWYNDKANFNPNTQQCNFNQPCGSYKQLVNAVTTDVGCAQTLCASVAGQRNLNFIVCYFGPAGNYDNEKTFTPGPACTKCSLGQFYCNKGLCDSTCSSAGPNCECKAECQNCGVKQSDCSCKCNPGSTGVDCSDECKDVSEKCNESEHGWTSAMCNNPSFPYVTESCPKFCGKCVEGTPCS